MDLSTKSTELLNEARVRLAEAEAIATKDNPTAEEMDKFTMLADEVKGWRSRAEAMADLRSAAQALVNAEKKDTGKPGPSAWKSYGEFLQAVFYAQHRGRYDPRLGKIWNDPQEPGNNREAKGWVEAEKPTEHKDMVENIGASGGFLVPPEFQTTLLQIPAPQLTIRPRATVVPIRRRQVSWPVLDQTNTTTGRPAWFGGILADWTEEGEYKTEHDAALRQISLVAHKLVTYTEVTDELLDDAAISLEALLTQLYQGAISWYEEQAFTDGTGAGMPLGIIPAGATFVQARAVVGAIGLVDIINMLEHSYGNPVWLITRSALPSLMQLNGPAGNPSYVFMPNARDGMPGTLFGYPVFWHEHCPQIGGQGDIILCDLRYYLIADRQATTIDSSKHYRFRYDITSWRAVHRVDGQPWLSQPIQLKYGTQVSPFVILGAGSGS